MRIILILYSNSRITISLPFVPLKQPRSGSAQCFIAACHTFSSSPDNNNHSAPWPVRQDVPRHRRPRSWLLPSGGFIHGSPGSTGR